jgi:hypothetical protein
MFQCTFVLAITRTDCSALRCLQFLSSTSRKSYKSSRVSVDVFKGAVRHPNQRRSDGGSLIQLFRIAFHHVVGIVGITADILFPFVSIFSVLGIQVFHCRVQITS